MNIRLKLVKSSLKSVEEKSTAEFSSKTGSSASHRQTFAVLSK